MPACPASLWPLAGSHLNGFWQKQRLYNPSVKPWKSGLANMLEEDPLFSANRAAQTHNTFTLRLGQLIESGAKVRRPGHGCACLRDDTKRTRWCSLLPKAS